jgi:hypothetical protein
MRLTPKSDIALTVLHQELKRALKLPHQEDGVLRAAFEPVAEIVQDLSAWQTLLKQFLVGLITSGSGKKKSADFPRGCVISLLQAYYMQLHTLDILGASFDSLVFNVTHLDTSPVSAEQMLDRLEATASRLEGLVKARKSTAHSASRLCKRNYPGLRYSTQAIAEALMRSGLEIVPDEILLTHVLHYLTNQPIDIDAYIQSLINGNESHIIVLNFLAQIDKVFCDGFQIEATCEKLLAANQLQSFIGYIIQELANEKSPIRQLLDNTAPVSAAAAATTSVS